MRGKLAIILLSVLLLTGCVRRPVSFALDENDAYTGFAQTEAGYTRQAARLYGWVVLEDLSVTDNVRIWRRFLQQAASGREAAVRVAEFFGEEMYLMDIFHHEGQYRAFFSDGYDQHDEPFPFLLTLTGQNNGQTAYAVVLSGDQDLTFDQVMRKLYSSQLDEDIPVHRILFLGAGQPDW